MSSVRSVAKWPYHCFASGGNQWGYIQDCIIQWVGSNAWEIIYLLENLIIDVCFSC